MEKLKKLDEFLNLQEKQKTKTPHTKAKITTEEKTKADFRELLRFQHVHTRLLSIILNLAYPVKYFPHVLYDLGYRIKEGSIEAHIPMEKLSPEINNKSLVPDVILTNEDKDHLLIFECKSGLIDKEQLEKYKMLKARPQILPEAGIIPFKKEPTHLTADVSYISITDPTQNKILKDENEIVLLQLIENNDNGKIELKRGNYQNPEVNEVFPITWGKREKPAYAMFPFDPELDYDLFMIHVLNELMNIALFGHDFPSKGMVFEEDLILSKGTIIKKDELWVLREEDIESSWKWLVERLGEIAPGEYIVKEDTIEILSDITLLRKDVAMDHDIEQLVNLIGLEVDMTKLKEIEFTVGELFERIYQSTGYSTYRFFHRDYKKKILQRLRDTLEELRKGSAEKGKPASSRPLRSYLHRKNKNRYRIKVMKDPKQIANFRKACLKAISGAEGRLRQKSLDWSLRVFLNNAEKVTIK